MKSEFQAKFLQNLLKKRQDEGFTLIELLVVIIIIGILSAIALPSFLNQANKARESEAKQYVGSLNRAQQAQFLERSTFTTSFGTLGLGISTATTNYSYSIASFSGADTVRVSNSGKATAIGDFAASDADELKVGVANLGQPTNTATLRAFMGAVDVKVVTDGEGATTVAKLCQSQSPNALLAGAIDYDPGTNPTSTDLGCIAPYEVLE